MSSSQTNEEVDDLKELMDDISGSQNVISEQALSKSPGILLEMQILGTPPTLHPTYSFRTPGVGAL